MAHTVLIAGTASHVGKSTVTAGLCRLLADRGVSVAPFKAQNMSNNAHVAPTPEGGWGEIGISQHAQARAARVAPRTDHNPVMLKPRGDGESQLVIDGRPIESVTAGGYYDGHWTMARRAAAEAHDRLAANHEMIVAEGAGGIAEINLHDRDLANVETAAFADASVVILADIERGGAFASLYGTLELLPADLRTRVVGAIITKFRGDRSLLNPGIEAIEARTGVPIHGVIPHDDPGLPAEDSVSLPDGNDRLVRGDDDGIDDCDAVTIAVPRLPRISNVSDLDPLAREPGVRVAFIPLRASLEAYDAVVLAGTKNSVDDLLACRAAGLGERLARFRGPIVGICGGYQLLGERLEHADAEGMGEEPTLVGFGQLPVTTRFTGDKRIAAVTRPLTGVGPLAGGSGSVSGYEIHLGETTVEGDVARPIGPSSAATDRVLGTYLHGLFENSNARSAFLDVVFQSAGVDRPARVPPVASPFDRAAELVAEHVDLEAFLSEPVTAEGRFRD